MPNEEDTKTPVWVKILIAAIPVIGVILVGYWQFIYKPAHSGPDKKASHQGRVIDKDSKKVIEGAKVSVEAKGVPPNVHTDSNGVFHLELSGAPELVRVRVEADGYEPFNEFVPLTEGKFEDIRLTSITAPGKPFEIAVGRNPTLSNVLEKLKIARHVKIDFNPNCNKSARQAVVEFNGGPLNGKDEVEFLEKVRARTNVNYEIRVIQSGSSYEIVCQ